MFPLYLILFRIQIKETYILQMLQQGKTPELQLTEMFPTWFINDESAP